MKKEEQSKIPKLAFDPYEYKKITYKGVDIYTRSLPWANCTFLKWIINNGAQDDKKGKEGTAHFLEHMVFDGNPLYENKKAIDQYSKEYLLDSLNAHTRFTDTTFVCKFLPSKVKPALEGFYNIMFKPLFRESDIEHERKVITQEGWGIFMNEKRIEYIKEWNKNVLKDVPEKQRMHSPLGWIDTVAKINKKDLVLAHQNYNRENSNIVLAGVVNESIIKEIKRIIDLVPSGNKRPVFKRPSKMSIPKEKRWIKTYSETGNTDSKQVIIDICRNIEFDKIDSYTLGGIETVLREILFRRLRHDNSWCYGVGVEFMKNSKYLTLGVWVKVAPENTKEAV